MVKLIVVYISSTTVDYIPIALLEINHPHHISKIMYRLLYLFKLSALA